MPAADNPPVAPYLMVRGGPDAIRPPQDEFYGRHGKLRDPFGHVWSITGPKKG